MLVLLHIAYVQGSPAAAVNKCRHKPFPNSTPRLLPQIQVTGAAASIKGENVDDFIDTEAAEDLTDSLIGALINVEAIVVNTLKPDGLLDNLPEAFGTEITNKMNLEFFKDATLGQVETLITGIISNDVLGRMNKLDNLLDIQLGNLVDSK